MSYCGACGGFFSPACPRYGTNEGCFPAPNPHEERCANLIALAVAVAAEIAGMVATNKDRENRGQHIAYTDVEFAHVAEKLRKEIGTEQ